MCNSEPICKWGSFLKLQSHNRSVFETKKEMCIVTGDVLLSKVPKTVFCEMMMPPPTLQPTIFITLGEGNGSRKIEVQRFDDDDDYHSLTDYNIYDENGNEVAEVLWHPPSINMEDQYAFCDFETESKKFLSWWGVRHESPLVAELVSKAERAYEVSKYQLEDASVSRNSIDKSITTDAVGSQSRKSDKLQEEPNIPNSERDTFDDFKRISKSERDSTETSKRSEGFTIDANQEQNKPIPFKTEKSLGKFSLPGSTSSRIGKRSNSRSSSRDRRGYKNGYYRRTKSPSPDHFVASQRFYGSRSLPYDDLRHDLNLRKWQSSGREDRRHHNNLEVSVRGGSSKGERQQSRPTHYNTHNTNDNRPKRWKDYDGCSNNNGFNNDSNRRDDRWKRFQGSKRDHSFERDRR
jgi:hypothetical protein